MSAPGPSAGRLVVVGAGGNIGSHLVPHLARLPDIFEVTLVDPGRYERSDLAGQAIATRDVGRSKVEVQAERLRSIAPSLEVRTVAEPVEQLPLGRLHGALVLTGLDTRRSRQFVSWAATRLGSPWIDAGVDGADLLARVDVYPPSAGGPCMECLWSAEDYRLLEQSYPCSAPGSAAATNAPSALGALAAALQALEARRLLAGEVERGPFGRQIVIDARHHRLLRTRLSRNPSCRLGHHRRWPLELLTDSVEEITVADLLAEARGQDGGRAARLGVAGRLFVRRAACANCSAEQGGPWLVAAWAPEFLSCPSCGHESVAGGFDAEERMDLGAAEPEIASISLQQLGVRPGDVLILDTKTGARRALIVGDRC